MNVNVVLSASQVYDTTAVAGIWDRNIFDCSRRPSIRTSVPEAHISLAVPRRI